MGTLCHELAHIKHMNHGPDFQALWSQLRNEVVTLQAKGYYGDGMWSSGTRLADSAKIVHNTLTEDDLPEYMCGGAQKRAHPSTRRRRQRPAAGSSTLTGAQTAKRRKAGSRVTAAGTFAGSGQALNVDESEKGTGTGFRKKAGSKRAREERALAAERRLLALQAASKTPTHGPEEDDSDNEVEELPETDKDRRQAMMTSMDATEADNLRIGTLADFWGDFILPKRLNVEENAPNNWATGDNGPPRDIQKGGRACLEPTARDVIRLEEHESLDQTIAKPRNASDSRVSNSTQIFKVDNVPGTRTVSEQIPKWSCLVCTLDNEPDHLACSACATPRGDKHWPRPVP